MGERGNSIQRPRCPPHTNKQRPSADGLLQPEKEAQLAKIAAQRGLKTDELAEQILSRYLEDDKRFIEAVNLGLAADRGEFVEHDEVGVRIKQLLQP